MSFTLKRV